MSKKNAYTFKTAGSGPRLVVVFGPPGCGVSTILRVLSSASETPNAIVDYHGPASIPMLEEAMSHCDVVFADVDGGIFGPSDVQALVDSGLLAGGMPGCLVRVYADDEDVMQRCADRPDYVTHDELREWSRSASALDDATRIHSLTYVMIPNSSIEEAARLLALRANLTR